MTTVAEVLAATPTAVAGKELQSSRQYLELADARRNRGDGRNKAGRRK